MNERVSVLVYTAVSVAAGIVSSFLERNVALVLGFALLGAMTYLMMKIMKKNLKFFGSSIFIYIFLWIITWTLVIS